jgi:hypothetical protein
MRRVGSCPGSQGLPTNSTAQPGLARLPGWRGSIKEFPISPCRPGIGELLELDPVVHQIPWRDFADSFAPCFCFNSAEKLQSFIPGINCWIELSTSRSSIVCDLPFQRYDSRPRAFENPPESRHDAIATVAIRYRIQHERTDPIMVFGSMPRD